MDQSLDFLNSLSDDQQAYIRQLITTNEDLKTKLKKTEEELSSSKNESDKKDGQLKSTGDTSSEQSLDAQANSSSPKSLKPKARKSSLQDDADPTKRRPGKQAFSKGFGRKDPKNAEEVLTEHKPEECLNCANIDDCMKKSKSIGTRKVIDLDVNVTLTVHKAFMMSCSLKDGEKLSGVFPNGLNSSIQFGMKIKSIIILLYTMGLSFAKIHSFLSAVMDDAAPSVGTLVKIVENFHDYKGVNITYDEILEMLEDKN